MGDAWYFEALALKAERDRANAELRDWRDRALAAEASLRRLTPDHAPK